VHFGVNYAFVGSSGVTSEKLSKIWVKIDDIGSSKWDGKSLLFHRPNSPSLLYRWRGHSLSELYVFCRVVLIVKPCRPLEDFQDFSVVPRIVFRSSFLPIVCF